MITVRTLSAKAFAKRKAELESRDGTKVTPELLAIAKRAIWKMKVRTRMKKHLEDRRIK